MKTMVKKRDFNKFNIEGFYIEDSLSFGGRLTEILAFDLAYNRALISFKKESVEKVKGVFYSHIEDIPDKHCDIYYRKKALKRKYEVWISLDNIRDDGLIEL